MSGSLDRLMLRAATPEDVGQMARQVLRGFEGYREFQPEGWEPPPFDREELRIRAAFERGAWTLLAFDGGTLAGHAMWEPAPDEEGVAHVRAVFTDPPWWGTGLAGLLLGQAVEAMRADGRYTAARLVTPERQARARTFYEREGWRPDGGAWWEQELAMSLVRYRRPLH